MATIGHEERGTSLPLVVAGSLVLNLLLWMLLGQGSNEPVEVKEPPELVFDRVTVEKKSAVVRPIAPKPQPKPAPIQPPKPSPVPEHKPPPLAAPPPPQGAHNRTVTAKSSAKAPENNFAAPNGGSAKLGVPTTGQNLGNAVANPPAPATPAPAPAPAPAAPQAPEPPKPNSVATQPTPTAAPAKPSEPPPLPKPKGPTREAQPDHQETVEVPESLKSQSFKSFVRVRVNISADATFTVTLRTSSGNADIDKLVLETLKKWTWKPALKDGDPVDSIQQFRFNFTVE